MYIHDSMPVGRYEVKHSLLNRSDATDSHDQTGYFRLPAAQGAPFVRSPTAAIFRDLACPGAYRNTGISPMVGRHPTAP